MSTKIYNGYQINVSSVNDLIFFSNEIRKKMIPVVIQILSKYMISYAGSYLDRLFCKQHVPSNDGSCRQILLNDLKIRLRKIEKEMIRDPEVDVFCNAVILPGDKYLAILYCENNLIKEVWDQDPRILEYGYWNNTDRPDDITEQEWDERESVWNKALGQYKYDIPALNGIIIDIINKILIDLLLYDIKYESLFDNYNDANTMNRRATDMVKDIMTNFLYKNIENRKDDTSSIIRDITRCSRLVKSNQFREHFTKMLEIIKKQLPNIDNKLFTTDIQNIQVPKNNDIEIFLEQLSENKAQLVSLLNQELEI